MHTLQGTNEVSTEWLKLYFETVDITRYVTGAVQPKLTQKNMNALVILVPTKEQCDLFNEMISPLFQLIHSNTREVSSLAKTRDYLLPRLMSGEIELDEAEEQVEEVLAHG